MGTKEMPKARNGTAAAATKSARLLDIVHHLPSPGFFHALGNINCQKTFFFSILVEWDTL